jgi:hypothetical protein
MELSLRGQASQTLVVREHLSAALGMAADLVGVIDPDQMSTDHWSRQTPFIDHLDGPEGVETLGALEPTGPPGPKPDCDGACNCEINICRFCAATGFELTPP